MSDNMTQNFLVFCLSHLVKLAAKLATNQQKKPITVRVILDVLQCLQVCSMAFDANCKEYSIQLTRGSFIRTFSSPLPHSPPLRSTAIRLETSSKEIVKVAYNSGHYSMDHLEWISALIFPPLQACRNELSKKLIFQCLNNRCLHDKYNDTAILELYTSENKD